MRREPQRGEKMHPVYETLAEVLNANPDPKMSFLDKTRPGPKTG